MPLSTLKPNVRSLARRGLCATLQSVPSSVFEPLRQSFPTTPPASFRHRAQKQALELIRHRGVPADLRSFPLADNPSISMANADSFIVERLYWFGEKKGYEPEVVRWWRHFCERSHDILELGSNIGYYAIQGAKANPSARYTAVEPHPGCAAVLRENLKLNEITNVRVVEAAAVDSADCPHLELHLPEGRDHYTQAPCTGFVGRNEVHQENIEVYRSVVVAAIELREFSSGIDLLKIDVEGREFDLLSSILDDVRASRPVMFLEVLDNTPKLRGLIHDLCSSQGYEAFVPTLNELAPLPPESLATVSMKQDFGTRDVVLSPAGERRSGPVP